MYLLTRWGNPLQCKCISNHQDIHFNYLIILFVNYTSIKLEQGQGTMSDHNKSVVWNKKGLNPEELATYLDGVWWAVEELPRAERAWRQPRECSGRETL